MACVLGYFKIGTVLYELCGLYMHAWRILAFGC